jgi:uncharacterized phage protein (predicted DNA packaging)
MAATYLVLATVKEHLHVDFDDDDTYIEGLMEMVEQVTANEIGDLLEDLEVESSLPLPIIQAMNLLLAHYYNIREDILIGVAMTKNPKGFDMLIAPYKNHTIG